MKLLTVLILLLLIGCNAEPAEVKSVPHNVGYDEQLADAIYKTENSKAHPYGIMIKYQQTTPRQACLNTITHARRDWNEQGDFIHFLGGRYCPSDTSNWVRSVKYFMNHKN
jgi:hypothetical protein